MKIQDCMISDQAHTLLDGFGQHEVGLHLAVERKLEAIGDPEITSSTQSGETGFLRSLFGKRRDLLVIQNSKFSEYVVLITAKPHGTILHVAWMVLVQPRLARDVRRVFQVDTEAGTRFEVGAELDALDTLDLRAFLGITRLALKHAIRELTDRDPDEDDLYVESANG